MALQLLFSDDLNPATGTLTPRFNGATGFYIDAPDITAELEIDVFLQVYLVNGEGQTIRNLALGKLKDGEIKLNETDTETITSIPQEFIDSGVDMALFFLPSETIALDVWLVIPDCNLCSIETQIAALETEVLTIKTEVEAVRTEVTEIKEQLNDLVGSQSEANGLIELGLRLLLNYFGVPIPVTPALPAAAEQTFFFLQ